MLLQQELIAVTEAVIRYEIRSDIVIYHLFSLLSAFDWTAATIQDVQQLLTFFPEILKFYGEYHLKKQTVPPAELHKLVTPSSPPRYVSQS